MQSESTTIDLGQVNDTGILLMLLGNANVTPRLRTLVPLRTSQLIDFIQVRK